MSKVPSAPLVPAVAGFAREDLEQHLRVHKRREGFARQLQIDWKLLVEEPVVVDLGVVAKRDCVQADVFPAQYGNIALYLDILILEALFLGVARHAEVDYLELHELDVLDR